MNANSQNFSLTSKPRIFNNPERFVEGWYWVLPSQKLGIKEVKSVTVLGRELAIYRGKNKVAVIVDAYCPHMGAHLAEGKVQGNELRCFFHHWQFDDQGFCVNVPCLNEPISIKLKTWPTAEKYGMIWVWTGEVPKQPLPFVLELEEKECDTSLGDYFLLNCHPNVVMINPIDAQHFNTVHQVSSAIDFEKQEINQNAIVFKNIKPNSVNSFFFQLIRFLCKNITHSICYWYGSTNIVTIGTEFFHVHVMFALRLLPGGKSEGQVILMIKKRPGILGWLYNRVLLWLTKVVGTHFIWDDMKIFQTIQLDLKTPIKADKSIIQFVNHLERQKPLMLKTWQLARLQNIETKAVREKWEDPKSND
ncbi:aromatic ring-hydroxylating dioxygenase subunit alpha [Umezakia ovalisporum]|uniref:Aromatic ring-hydroxylating dioxygenase subunit alpha n=1 Tax=Umezakia ovalisporum FSS-62 TaxID=2971776 RepID=A0AA43H2Y2_9CYAN|nr:aromatic ring-hydroxylating dioxygenase subunit alpha [Umezakia ovalisporum]MDH6065660.1 aromatic ring-hydroxylating dioxygenase subunit alpha [Umezakia ovalisporum FSS-62]MDH6076533.1 aromatic ring-hydroxylating dioxygenase subunit alpha [Umezakia ovalisporum FSS-45]MDH6103897.1 aromatic ring-hydroxylating dioxygenase subunit alpha [Umezakia ovalisporum ANA283AFssAo]